MSNLVMVAAIRAKDRGGNGGGGSGWWRVRTKEGVVIMVKSEGERGGGGRWRVREGWQWWWRDEAGLRIF